MIVLCFLGNLLVQMRVFIQGIAYYDDDQRPGFPGDPGYINALFAGTFLETIFLVSYIIIVVVYTRTAYCVLVTHSSNVCRITALFSNTVIAVQKLQYCLLLE